MHFQTHFLCRNSVSLFPLLISEVKGYDVLSLSALSKGLTRWGCGDDAFLPGCFQRVS